MSFLNKFEGADTALTIRSPRRTINCLNTCIDKGLKISRYLGIL